MPLKITEICLLTEQNCRYSFTVNLFYLFFVGFDTVTVVAVRICIFWNIMLLKVESRMMYQKLLVYLLDLLFKP
jgi:hypothetical protein